MTRPVVSGWSAGTSTALTTTMRASVMPGKIGALRSRLCGPRARTAASWMRSLATLRFSIGTSTVLDVRLRWRRALSGPPCEPFSSVVFIGIRSSSLSTALCFRAWFWIQGLESQAAKLVYLQTHNDILHPKSEHHLKIVDISVSKMKTYCYSLLATSHCFLVVETDCGGFGTLHFGYSQLAGIEGQFLGACRAHLAAAFEGLGLFLSGIG